MFTYGWLSAEHLDPAGDRLASLKHFFLWLRGQKLLEAGAGLFWDFASFPQKPRLPDEDSRFKEALKVMAGLIRFPGCRDNRASAQSNTSTTQRRRFDCIQ